MLHVARLSALFLLLVSSSLRAGELTQEEQDAGFVSMFNGKDFTGWRFSGADEGPNWQVKGGVIHLSGGGRPHLATATEYGDFEMRFEWRAGREKYNSGFYVRSGEKLGKNQINLAKGAEGAFIHGKVEGAKAVGSLQNPPGEWNEWRIIAQGANVEFYCNGELAWKGTGLTPASGYIGFQAEGAPMEFRHLRIRTLPSK